MGNPTSSCAQTLRYRRSRCLDDVKKLETRDDRSDTDVSVYHGKGWAGRETGRDRPEEGQASAVSRRTAIQTSARSAYLTCRNASDESSSSFDGRS
jgi:hypothetical protein